MRTGRVLIKKITFRRNKHNNCIIPIIHFTEPIPTDVGNIWKTELDTIFTMVTSGITQGSHVDIKIHDSGTIRIGTVYNDTGLNATGQTPELCPECLTRLAWNGSDLICTNLLCLRTIGMQYKTNS